MSQVNMEKHWSTVCALVLTLGAFVHFDIVFAADVDGSLTGMFVFDSHSLYVFYV